MRSVADRITTLIDSALPIADKFFTDHFKYNTVIKDFDDTIHYDYLIVAKDSAGGELQGQLDDLLTQIDELAVSIDPTLGIADATDECRELYRDGARWLGPAKSHNAVFTERIKAVREVVRKLPDSSRGVNLLVADTNSLLHNPAIETWTFDGIAKFTLILASTVLGELDSFENSNKNESVRAKAKTLVRKFKDYRSRKGKLHDGIDIVTGKIKLQVIPIEPTFDESVNWLKPESPDDRIIARVISLIRQHPHSVVALVTRDVNLQTRADYAGLYFIEPPDPPATR